MILNDNLKQSIKKTYSSILQGKNLTSRKGQKEMIAFIANTLNDAYKNDKCSAALIEAGTGTGKTLGYLIGTIPVAQVLQKKVIVSTATIALQEQILSQDLPSICENSDLKFNFKLAKGRSRYVCLEKLDAQLQSNSNFNLFDEEKKTDTIDDTELYQKLMTSFSKREWLGDKESWKGSIDKQLWQNISATHNQCKASKCPYFSSCPFFNSRKELATADLIVANHDLVLTDLKFGGGVLLPEPQNCIYIFDEGHHLPQKTIKQFAQHVLIKETKSIFEKIDKQIDYILKITKKKVAANSLQNIKKTCKDLILKYELIFAQLQPLIPNSNFTKEDKIYRFSKGVIPESLKDIADDTSRLFNFCNSETDYVIKDINYYKDCNEFKNIDLESSIMYLNDIKSIFISNEALWRLYIDEDKLYGCNFDKNKQQSPFYAKWIKAASDISVEDIHIHASPTQAKEALTDKLWSKAFAVIITSATLTTSNKFDYFIESAGVPINAKTIKINSSFDYEKNGTIYLPALKHNPKENQLYTEEIAELFPELLEKSKGTLVLFASKKLMRDVYFKLDIKIKKNILMQNQLQFKDLIKKHKKHIDKNKSSIIFGLASFAEGIDLKGCYCEHVIIVKIPFSSPNNPIDATLSEWLESKNINPFLSLAIPEAIIRLIQATGRLLRDETDSGRITILDNRLLTKRYGERILNSLPNYKRKLNQS